VHDWYQWRTRTLAPLLPEQEHSLRSHRAGIAKQYSSPRGVSGQAFIYPCAGIVRSTARRDERDGTRRKKSRSRGAGSAGFFERQRSSAPQAALPLRFVKERPGFPTKGQVGRTRNEADRSRRAILSPSFVTAHRNCIITSARYVIAIVAASREKT